MKIESFKKLHGWVSELKNQDTWNLAYFDHYSKNGNTIGFILFNCFTYRWIFVGMMD